MWQRSGGSRHRWLDQGGAQVSKDLRSRCSAQKNLTMSVRDMYFIPSICALVVPCCSPACIGKGPRLRFKRSSQHKHLSSYKKVILFTKDRHLWHLFCTCQCMSFVSCTHGWLSQPLLWKSCHCKQLPSFSQTMLCTIWTSGDFDFYPSFAILHYSFSFAFTKNLQALYHLSCWKEHGEIPFNFPLFHRGL